MADGGWGWGSKVTNKGPYIFAISQMGQWLCSASSFSCVKTKRHTGKKAGETYHKYITYICLYPKSLLLLINIQLSEDQEFIYFFKY